MVCHGLAPCLAFITHTVVDSLPPLHFNAPSRILTLFAYARRDLESPIHHSTSIWEHVSSFFNSSPHVLFTIKGKGEKYHASLDGRVYGAR